MKLLFDQNLSPSLAKRLADIFAASSHVMSHAMDEADDVAVWQFARENAYTIVTKDSDFYDLSLLQGFPPNVILIRLGNCTTTEIEALIRAHENDIRLFDADEEAGTLVLQ